MVIIRGGSCWFITSISCDFSKINGGGFGKKVFV